MSPSLEKILSEIEQLTPEDQLTVMGHLVEHVKKHITQAQPKRSRERFERYGTLSAIR